LLVGGDVGLEGVPFLALVADQEPVDVLPEDLHDAIRLAESSEVLRDVLGEHVHGFLIRNKREEWDAFNAHVTPYEQARYLPIL
jgi:glutamine synthetase